MVSSMGYLLSQIETPPEGCTLHFDNLYLFCNVIATALQYESDNPHFFCRSAEGV